MSTFMHAESRRLYSWWWDSHISPKNSKWLQENLTDMDLKVKAMIKLIEEDADSFARRAEMYYKKRPELMKFVEDFYRAYRALAERYDHATGALRHAHRTIAEAFPNHIPLALPDESPCISPGTEIGPCTPEIPSPLCSLLDPDDLQKDAYAEENELFATKKGLKQLNELFAPWEATNRVKLHEGKVRKGLKFQEGEDGASPSKVHESKILLEQEVKEKENARNEIKRLQEEVSQLSIENQKLKAQIESESTNFDSSRSEVRNLRDAITELQSEKEAAFLRDRLSGMETEILNANYEFDKLHEEMMLEIIKFCFVEEQCFSLDKANQSIELEFEQSNKVLGELRALLVEKAVEKDNAKNEIKRFHEQLSLISNENKSLKIQLLSETEHLQFSRAEVQSMRDVLLKLEYEKEAAVLMNQILQKSVYSLEAENIQAKDEIGTLYAEILMGVVNLCTAEEQYLALAKAYQMLKLELEDRKKVLEEIQMLSVESQNLLEQEVKEKENIKNEIECLQGEISQLSIDNQNMKSQIVSKAMHLDAYRTEVQNLRNVVSILEREKEDAAFKNELSLKSMSSLESEICRGKDEITKLHEEVLMGIVKLYGAEEQNFALENACQNLKVEIEVRKTMFEDLRISLQESENQRMEAERSLKSSERLYNLSQEKVAHATLEIQTHSEKLKDIEHSKMVLEEEVRQLEYVNYDLNEHILAYDSKLKLLQDEIISLKEVNRKLEDEMSLHFEDRKVRQQELDSVKDDRDELDLKHKALIEQMEVASLNMESLEILIKELQFGCSELKEGCRKLEDEKLLLFNKLLDMETISERNTVLEISLSDAMEKIRVLEDFCESLNAKDSTHVVEKAALFSQNSLLENSLADANTELEVLRSKSKELEESSQFLSAQNSNLLLQKNALISQVEDIHYSLLNLVTKYAPLEFNHLNLEEEDVSVAQGTELEDSSKIMKKEHESLIQSCRIYFLSLENQIHLLQEYGRFKEEELEAVNQEFMRYIIEVLVLQRCLCDIEDSLRTENQKYESLMQSGEIQLAALECQINLMQEKAQVRDREFEEQQQNYMNSILEIFILQRCLSEMKEKNLVLLNECREHTEASRRAGELISQLEGSKQLLKEENAALVDQNVKLVERCEKFGQDMNEKEQTNSSLKAELESLCRLLSDLSKNFSALRDEKSALEEENNVLLEEAVALEHLYLFFRSSNAENLQSLKVLDYAIDSLAAVKNDHKRQIRESEKKLKLAEYENGRLNEASLILLEELGSRTTMLEYDLSTARHFCDELMLQVEIGENLLEEKSMELAKAYHKLQCAQVEVTELCAKLGAAANEVDEAKTTRLQFEEKVAGLLEAHACKDVEISATHEENRMLNEELNRWNRKFEALRKREQYLSSELQKKICELDMCEGETTDLLINIHFSQVNGAVLEDKIFEWGVAYEGLEICALVQREMLIQEITLRNAHAFELQKKLDDLEKENSKLKAIWNSCSPLFISLENGIANVENQAHQLANVHEDQNISSTDPQEKKSNETGKGDLVTIAGVLELQNLVSKLKEIENLMLNSNHQLKQERLLYASSLESARREIEDLKLEASDEQVKQGKESSVGKDGQMMKDIELDRASNSIVPSRIQSAESEDQMLKLWETAEIDYNNSAGHDIEGAPEFKSEQHSSEIVAEKEVGVDRLEISKEMKESQEDWNRRVIERLSIGGEKLSALKPTAQKLGAKLERSGKRERRKCSEHDAMQAKLKQVEEGIPSLFDTDGKLRKKLEEHSTFSNGERMGWLERRQVWEQVLMVMDQIEKFELELQEVQYYFAKLDEEAESNGTREGDRTPPQVLLRDYIKGWRVGQGRKGGRICGCIRPKTRE